LKKSCSLRLFFTKGSNRESRPFPRIAFKRKLPSHIFEQYLDSGQAQAVASHAVIRLHVHLEIAFEDLLVITGRNPFSVVAHGNHKAALTAADSQDHALLPVLEGIRQKVPEDLFHLALVQKQIALPKRFVNFKKEPMLGKTHLKVRQCLAFLERIRGAVIVEVKDLDQSLLHELGRGERGFDDDALAGAAKLQSVVHQRSRDNGVPQRPFQNLDLLVVQSPVLVLLLEQRQDARLDHRERHLEVMDEEFQLDSVSLHRGS